MLNYEHEIKEIKDRFLKQYIFYDYFHDSLITKIIILNDEKKVQLELSCEREWPERNWDKYAGDVKYRYVLTFENCVYVEYERENFGSYTEYLNGRFKKSAKLKQILLKTKKNYYHLRIQLADGYIDMIFSKFLIEKQEGNIALAKRISIDWYFDTIDRKFNQMELTNIRKLAFDGEFPLRTRALEYLWIIKDQSIEGLSIEALKDEDTCIPGVFILGEIGNVKNLSYLMDIFKFSEDVLFRRHIKDACEKILFR